LGVHQLGVFPEALASSHFFGRSPKGETTKRRGVFSLGFGDQFFDSVVFFPQATLFMFHNMTFNIHQFLIDFTISHRVSVAN